MILALMEIVNERELHHCDIRVLADSSSVASFFRKMGGRSEAMCDIAITLGLPVFLRQRSIRIPAEWRPGTFMISCGVDGASRPTALHPGELEPSGAWYLEVITRLGHTPTVDLFASAANTKCETWWLSRKRQRGCLSADALSASWTALSQEYGGPLWCFPPMGRRCLARVVDKLLAEAQHVLCILPWDPTLRSTATLVAASAMPPILFQPSGGSLAYPDTKLLTAWLQQSRAASCLSASGVWAAWNLFAPIAAQSSAQAGLEQREARLMRFRHWAVEVGRPMSRLGNPSCTTAATEISTIACAPI